MDRTKPSRILKDDVNEKLKSVKSAHGFESDSETVNYLIHMENELRSKQMIKKSARAAARITSRICSVAFITISIY